MRQVLQHIGRKRSAFSQVPFFTYLLDKSTTPQERLSFAPAGAPFIMAFADLNKHVLFENGPADDLQDLINVHSREDATHFAMYLRDLETLGYDLPLSFTDALEFLWSDRRKSLRTTCYKLAGLLEPSSTKLRIVIVEVIEALGSAAFETFAQVASEFRSATGKSLEYFGRPHEQLETGHTIGTDEIEERLHAVVLTEDERARSVQMVDSIFDSFSAMMAELHEYVLTTRPYPAAAGAAS
ncbi:MAG: hypothetical protein HOW73_51015 [Polyangiaceae bacterium]|nr:hypothetical protein [Polyangiaceae bacterium]